MQILSLIATVVGIALACATLVSTLAALFGRARLQRNCAFYREESTASVFESTAVVAALHLKALAKLIAEDAYPARWTLFTANALTIFGMILSGGFAEAIAVQDAVLQDPGVFGIPLFCLFILPGFAMYSYVVVVLKRTKIRRQVAQQATGVPVDGGGPPRQVSVWEKTVLTTLAAVPSVVVFVCVFFLSLDGKPFAGPSWALSAMVGVFFLVLLIGGFGGWHVIPRLTDHLESYAVEPIRNLPSLPNERDDVNATREEKVSRAVEAELDKRRKREADSDKT